MRFLIGNRKKTFILRSFAFILTAILLLSVLSGCGSASTPVSGTTPASASTPASGATSASGTTAAPSAAQRYKLSVILDTTSLSNPLVLIAKDKGYFDQLGLDISYQNLNTGTIEAISIGKVEVLTGGIIPSLTYGSQKADIKIIGGTASGGNYLVVKPENYDKYQDFNNWKGAKLGDVRLSTSQVVTRNALEQKGFDVTKDVKFVEIAEYPDIVSATAKGSVDIGYISSQYVQSAQSQGLKVLMPMTGLAPNYLCCRVTVNGSALKKQREKFVLFLEGEILAYKVYQEDHDYVIKSIAKSSGQTEDFVKANVYDTDTNGNRIYDPDPNVNSIKSYYKTMEDWGVLQAGVNPDDFIDRTIYLDALNAVLKQYPDDPIYKKLLDDYNASDS